MLRAMLHSLQGRPRLSFPGARMLLAAVALFTAGLGPSNARAQPCVQPAPEGCPIEPGQPAEAAIEHPEEAHFWRLAVPSGARGLQLVLSNVPADYQLSVYGPDDVLAGVSNEEGPADEVIELEVAAPGNYAIFVDSPYGASSSEPYRLLATLVGYTPDAADAPLVPREASSSSEPDAPSPMVVVVLSPSLTMGEPEPRGPDRPVAAATPTPATDRLGTSHSTYIGMRTRQVLPYDPFGPDRDCHDFASWALAQDFFEAGGGTALDRHDLDPDRDGVACQELRDRERPAAPAGLAGIYDPTRTSIRLTWVDRSNNERGFKVQVQLVNGSLVRLDAVPANATSATVSGLLPSSYYCYDVWAFTDFIESDRVAICDSQVPVAPTGFTGAYEVGKTSIRLSWQDRSDNEQGFKVEVLQANGSVVRTTSLPANSTNTTVTGLSPSGRYCYSLWAYNQWGESERAWICD